MPLPQGSSQTAVLGQVVRLDTGVRPLQKKATSRGPGRGHISSSPCKALACERGQPQSGSARKPSVCMHRDVPMPSVTPGLSLSTIPLAALTYKCTRDQWTVYCRVIREKNLCQDMRWYQRCCQTCRDFYANKMRQPPPPLPSS